MKITEAKAKQLGMVKKNGSWVASIQTEEIVESAKRTSGNNAGMAKARGARMNTPVRRTPAEAHRDLVESFMAMGMDEPTAELAARSR
jgi:hypothetical protein